MYLQYPKCFEESSNPEKQAILNDETGQVLCLWANDFLV